MMRPQFRKNISVSICIPARNESGNIENAILRLPKFGKHQEIIFVEGNSSDDTWQKIQEIQEKYRDSHDIKIAQQARQRKRRCSAQRLLHCHAGYSDDSGCRPYDAARRITEIL
jgi:glycosyltransferase involved in cell wall biosynthesis